MRRFLGLLLFLTALLYAAPYASAAPNGVITLGLDEEGTGTYTNVRVSVAHISINGLSHDSDVPAFTRGGRTMVPVRLIAEKLGAKVQWFADTNEVSFTKADQTVRLKIGSANALVNGESVTLPDRIPAMVAKYNGTVRTMVPLRFVSEYLGAHVAWIQKSYTAVISTPISGQKTVVLDPGHGGSQTGARYEGIGEKDINLAVAKRVEAALIERGYNVIMTRSADIDVGLYERAALANAVNADIFVSIHSNAAEQNKDFTGIYTYYYPTSKQGGRLAQSIQTELCKQSGAIDRGILGDDFAVLRETKMSAALVELGFMTNSSELQLLTTASYQEKLAVGIAGGIDHYFDRNEHSLASFS